MISIRAYLWENRRALYGAIVLAVINQVFSLLDPQIFRLIIDNYASHIKDFASLSIFLRGVMLLLAASVGVAFVSRVAKNFQDYFVNVISQRIGTRLYAAGVERAFAMPYQVFEDERSGALLQLLQKAKNDVQTSLISFINVVFVSLVGIVFVMIYAYITSPVVALAYVTIIPTLGTATYYLGRRIKQAQKAIVAEAADLAGSTTETIRNVELVKSLGLEAAETLRLNSLNASILALELKKIKFIRLLSFVQGTLVNLLRVSILLLMLWLVFLQHITLGEFFTLYFYSFLIFTPLGDLGNVLSQYQEARGSLESLTKALSTPIEAKPVNPQAVPNIKEVAFNKVSFAYQTASQEAVKEISLTAKAGETIAFVGPSGSGKSTLVKLIVGLYKPSAGELLINNKASSEIDYNQFRSHIGYVSQETQLFAGTIRDNLLFVNHDATDDDCHLALREAEALGIIERGGQDLETRIGEGGVKLSGGEKQRIAIARALIRKPDLIIFDEATSSLDSLTERAITETIKTIGAHQDQLLTIMIAHRLSTVIHADKIFVLEKGQVVETGNHEMLVKKGGLYAALWREQGGLE